MFETRKKASFTAMCSRDSKRKKTTDQLYVYQWLKFAKFHNWENRDRPRPTHLIAAVG